MVAPDYSYLIVGGGLAAASAVEGIREVDKTGSILLISQEKHLPYHRPPLTKQLWSGKKKVESIFVKGRQFYDDNGVRLALSTKAMSIDPRNKTVADDQGRTVSFGKLLLATGGDPKRLSISGGDMEGVCYYRYLDDYLAARAQVAEGKSAVVIGGGFIGSEIAAALSRNGVAVTMVFPGAWLCNRVFPAGLGQAIQKRYQERGINIIREDRPADISRAGGRWLTRTGRGGQVASDLLIVGVGIEPSVGLAQAAGLQTGDGIVVDERLRTSHPDIYAAGDNACFPYKALGVSTRIEHWDNALSQGKCAGRNMAGSEEPFTYMPYFFSDLFEFGYEAVGEVDSRLETFADWEKENDTGVVYYLRDGVIRGAMMCNAWKKIDTARDMIRQARRLQPA
jgi:3-phenylpropionate/trans-cinnamate dioxygenase ferredoxin reductase component